MKIQFISGDLREVIKRASTIAGAHREGVFRFLKIDLLTKSVIASGEKASLVQKANFESDEEQGAFLVDAMKLNSLISTLPQDAKVIINATDEKVEMRTGRSKFKLATLLVSKFAVGVLKDVQGVVTMPTETLSMALEKASHYVGQKDVRAWANGILLALEPEKKVVEVVATNGHFLNLFQTDSVTFNSETYSKTQYIIDPIFAKMIASLRDNGESVKIEFYDNSIMFRCGETSLWGRIIDARFPEYKKIASLFDCQEDDKFAIIPVKVLQDSLSRIAAIRNEHGSVVLAVDGGVTSLTSESKEGEIGYDEIDLKLPFDDKVAVNSSYLSTILKTHSEDNVGLAQDQNTKAIHFKNKTGLGILYQMLMPMRL